MDPLTLVISVVVLAVAVVMAVGVMVLGVKVWKGESLESWSLRRFDDTQPHQPYRCEVKDE